MSVTTGQAPSFTPGLPVPLFDLRIAQTLWWDYAAMPGGQEFIIKQATSTSVSSPLTVVLNWQAALRP
jgi:hypothetical protein